MHQRHQGGGGEVFIPTRSPKFAVDCCVEHKRKASGTQIAQLLPFDAFVMSVRVHDSISARERFGRLMMINNQNIDRQFRQEEHTSQLPSIMPPSLAVSSI